MHKYTHIESIYRVNKYIKKTNKADIPEEYKVKGPVCFRGTVKLHGTNSSVVCAADTLTPQSRNRQLSLDNDNCGFAAFVDSVQEGIRAIETEIRDKHNIPSDTALVLYGEWIGPGIQKGMAISKLPDKQWVLFAAKIVEGDESRYVDVIGPLEDRYAEHRIFSVYDVSTYSLEIDFSSEESKQAAIQTFEKLTEQIDKQCPWGTKFGLEGPGEGIVWIPVGDHWGHKDLYWKSKGSKHKEVQRPAKSKGNLDPAVLESVEKFLNFAVTETRLNKGLDYLREMNKPIDMPSMGDFIKWVSQDVRRECADELEANQLDWKQVSKGVGAKARGFFKRKVQTL